MSNANSSSWELRSSHMLDDFETIQSYIKVVDNM